MASCIQSQFSEYGYIHSCRSLQSLRKGASRRARNTKASTPVVLHTQTERRMTRR